MRSKFHLSFIAALSLHAAVAKAQVITTIVGNGNHGYSGDGGFAFSAQLNNCTGVSFDGAGNVYIADRDNNVVRRINSVGIISTFAGNGTSGYSGDGSAAIAAKLNKPTNIATDAAGNVYIADNGNNVIRKVTPLGTISTYAGNGTAGFSGDADSARFARLSDPQGMAADASGNLFIADAGNHVIRMVDADRLIHTVVGSGSLGSGGNGGMASSASLSEPTSVAVDAAGNLYIADHAASVIRKVDGTTGIISTVAGNGINGSGGDGGAAVIASLKFPSAVSVDGAGNIYIADQGNNTIRKVNTAGTISTYAGSITNGYSGDGGQPALAQLNSPRDVAVDGWGRVYIADYGNNVVRKVAMPTGVGAVAGNGRTAIYPNPASSSFTVDMLHAGSITLIDATGRIIEKRTTAMAGAQLFATGTLPAGSYFVKVDDRAGSATETITIMH